MQEHWYRKYPINDEYKVLEEKNYVDESYRPYNEGPLINVNRRPPYVTYVLLGLTILAYLLMSLFGFLYGWDQGEQLILFGAKVNILIAYGQYWRLLTAMFLHIGILHLFFNSYALYIYGPIVESLFGKMKFIVVYLISGLTGSLLSYIFSSSISAGASGAIFGLMGSLLYFGRRNKDIFRRIFGPRLLIIIGFNLFYGFVNPGIDNWGHIGGLIGGYLVGNAVGLYKEPILQLRKIIVWILIFLMFYFGMRYGEDKYKTEFMPRPRIPIPSHSESLELDNIEEPSLVTVQPFLFYFFLPPPKTLSFDS
ncbi:MAG: rhomboid family intramembrane serine protease [Clostridia bacterium]|nr:rhomboid family intramembrane serine protease [Clostridia bacterium]MDD4680840.1 rhomboid family intramembrane serine protease [Clostridia bacterium]